MKSDVTLPGRRRAGRARARDEGHRGLRRLHRERLQEGRAQARARCRRVFPAVLHLRRCYASRKDQFLVFERARTARPSSPSIRGDFTPLAIGTGRILEKVPIVFAGYGITAKNSRRHPGLDYDDYAERRRQGQGRADPAPRAAAAR